MTETSHPDPADTRTPPGDGVDREHLRNYRELRRSRTDRRIAGVAGGLARHLDIDPLIVRVVFFVLIFFGGAGLLLYAVAWLLVPREDTGQSVVTTDDTLRNALLIGAGIIAILVALSDGLNGWGLPWLLAAVVIGIVLVSRRDRSGTPPAPTGPMAAPAGGAPTLSYVAPARPRRTGPLLFGPTLALGSVALGILGMVDTAGADVPGAAYPALALAVTGVMLVVGAFRGRPGGLVLLGLVAAFATLVSSVGEPGFSGERDLVVRPLTAGEVEDSYVVPAGRLELDLSRVADVTALDGRTLELSANVGEIVVILPPGASVSLNADIDLAGSVDLPVPPGVEEGWDVDIERRIPASESPELAAFELDIELAAGHIEVRQ